MDNLNWFKVTGWQPVFGMSVSQRWLNSDSTVTGLSQRIESQVKSRVTKKWVKFWLESDSQVTCHVSRVNSIDSSWIFGFTIVMCMSRVTCQQPWLLYLFSFAPILTTEKKNGQRNHVTINVMPISGSQFLITNTNYGLAIGVTSLVVLYITWQLLFVMCVGFVLQFIDSLIVFEASVLL